MGEFSQDQIKSTKRKERLEQVERLMGAHTPTEIADQLGIPFTSVKSAIRTIQIRSGTHRSQTAPIKSGRETWAKVRSENYKPEPDNFLYNSF